MSGAARGAPRAPRITVIGDVLLEREVVGDLNQPAAERSTAVVSGRSLVECPGGAARIAVLIGQLEPRTRPILVAALGPDDPARRIARALHRLGIRHAGVHNAPPTPTVLHVTADERTLLRLEFPGAGTNDGANAPGAERTATAPAGEVFLSGPAVAALHDADVVIAVDRGHGLLAAPDVARTIAALVDSGTPVVWMPQPHGVHAPDGVVLATDGRACTGGATPACSSRTPAGGCDPDARHAIAVGLMLARGGPPSAVPRHPRCARLPA